MSEKSLPGAERLESGTGSQSPAPPAMGEGREDGASVSRLAQARMSAFVRGERVRPAVSAGRKAGHSVPWSALSFGMLLLASLSACLERLAWMGQH